MANSTYEYFKETINSFLLPACVFAVKKGDDGLCSEATFFVVNEVFKKSFLETFRNGEHADDFDSDEVAKMVEGTHYYDHMPKDIKFETLLIEAAWENKHIHTYVDTTMMYGYWTEDYMIPIEVSDEERKPNVAYCQFMYTLNKEMDTNKYSNVSPDIASFVIKTCLELRNENDFYSSMDTVTKYIREYTASNAASVLSYQADLEKYEVISGATDNPDVSLKEIFKQIPFSVIASWEKLFKTSNCIIIKDDNDFAHYESLAPEWIATLKPYGIFSVCLVPFIHQGSIIGFLYITNFDVTSVTRVKETIEMVSFFLSAEVANHLFLERLEYLSNVDILTGVKNRNCMNVDVDELALKMEFDPRPFTVAFCDLNGLKTINDNQGHDAGDKLIVAAANILKEVFPDDNIYRAGGDEFSIISTHGSEEDFKKKIDRLRELASVPEWLCFAIGYYHDETEGKLRLAMR